MSRPSRTSTTLETVLWAYLSTPTGLGSLGEWSLDCRTRTGSTSLLLRCGLSGSDEWGSSYPTRTSTQSTLGRSRVGEPSFPRRPDSG